MNAPSRTSATSLRFADARRITDPLVEAFVNGEIDEVLVVYPQWQGLGSQPPTVRKLLPIEPPAKATEEESKRVADFIFSPDAGEILADLLPRYVTQTMYTMLVMSHAGEQVARRTAMKSATDNAQEMLTNLTRTLNRARPGTDHPGNRRNRRWRGRAAEVVPN